MSNQNKKLSFVAILDNVKVIKNGQMIFASFAPQEGGSYEDEGIEMKFFKGFLSSQTWNAQDASTLMDNHRELKPVLITISYSKKDLQDCKEGKTSTITCFISKARDVITVNERDEVLASWGKKED